MKKSNLLNKGMVFIIIAIFCSLAIMPAVGTSTFNDYPLPPPIPVDMIFEESIFRRMSVREFTEDPVTDEELSTILWAAYGYTDDGNRTVHGIDGTYAAHIYVLKEDAVYTYDPLNHSLIHYKDGDYRDIVGWQYKAPIQLGIAWDKDISSDENLSGAEIGEIGQNIQFMANALDLGTVVTAEIPSPLDRINLPSNEVGKIVMPLGHPEHPYRFIYLPLWLSLLPRIKKSEKSLSSVIQDRTDATSFEGELSRSEISQVLWASYGYSYLLDICKDEKNPLRRHRTIPSAHGYYPLRIYAVTESGIYRYIPGLFDYDKIGFPIVTFLFKIRSGDMREDVAQASQPYVASAPMSIIVVLDIQNTNKWDDLSGPRVRWIWYYEAGASVHNVLLETTAQNLKSNIVTPVDTAALLSLLRLNENYQALLIVPVGK